MDTVALVALCALLVLLPPRYDPAIRLKERHLQRARARRRSSGETER